MGEGGGFLLAQSTVYTTCDGKKKREVHHHVETEGYDPGTSACFFHFFISLFSAFQMLLCVCDIKFYHFEFYAEHVMMEDGATIDIIKRNSKFNHSYIFWQVEKYMCMHVSN